MRIWIFSDLHLEFEPLSLAVPDADVCVCAGDVSPDGVLPTLDWLAHIGQVMPVVAVAGNHEFYYSSFTMCQEHGKRHHLDRPWQNVYFLEDSAVMINGVRFVGATLWTDYRLLEFPESAMAEAETKLSDYRHIKFSKQPYRRFRPIDAFRKHMASIDYFKSLEALPPERTVVVTHHAPSAQSLPEHLRNDPLAPAFASGLETLVRAMKPDLWVHGHIHQKADYALGATRVICNPRGYPNERLISGFDPALVIEI